MTDKLSQTFARVDIPHFDHCFPRSRDDFAFEELYRVDGAIVSENDTDQFTCFQRRYPNGRVFGSTDDVLVIKTDI